MNLHLENKKIKQSKHFFFFTKNGIKVKEKPNIKGNKTDRELSLVQIKGAGGANVVCVPLLNKSAIFW